MNKERAEGIESFTVSITDRINARMRNLADNDSIGIRDNLARYSTADSGLIARMHNHLLSRRQTTWSA